MQWLCTSSWHTAQQMEGPMITSMHAGQVRAREPSVELGLITRERGKAGSIVVELGLMTREWGKDESPDDMAL